MKKRRLLAFLLACVLCIQCFPMSSAARSAENKEARRDAAAEVSSAPTAQGDAEQIDPPDGDAQNISEDQITPMDDLPSEPISGYCGGEGDGTNLTWTLDSDGVLTISGTGKMRNYSNSITPWYSYRTSVLEVIISNAVTSIGHSAFSDCSNLASVSIGSSVTSIIGYAFDGCSSLTSVAIPDSVTSIGDHAFDGCSSLTNVTIPDSVTSIGECAFYDCSSLTSVSIPDSVTSIGHHAFYGCNSLTSVTIGNSVTSIDYHTFYHCSSLTSVTIGNSVTSIDDSAFSGCSSLTSVTIPDSVTSIGTSTFSGCSSLTSVAIPDSVTSIGSSTFSGCNSLTSVAIPDSVTSIGSSTFSGCSSLTSVTIPDSVTSIGNSAFKDCSSLTNVAIPDSVTSIGSSTFYGCSGLTSVAIPDSVTSIGTSTFSGCSSLTSVTIPGSVTSIGPYTFYHCSSLTSVTIGNSVTSIGEDAFYGCSNLTSVTIPDSVTSIGDYAFDGCSSLTNVTIGNSVTSIGKDAFYGCSSLTSVTIPDSVTSIGNSAFINCSSLTSVAIPDSVTSIGSSTFSGCSSLTSVTIGNSVTSIDVFAFSGCNSLTSVTIPGSVTSIGKYAFTRCNSLTSVYFKGNAPAAYGVDSSASFPTTTLYYIPGTSGWIDSEYYDAEAGTWNGYKLDTWEPAPELTDNIVVSSNTPELRTGELLGLSIASTTKLDNAYLQFDNGQGEWLSTAFCAECSSYAISPYHYDITDTGYLYSKSLPVNMSTGYNASALASLMDETQADGIDIYSRKVRVISENENGSLVYSNEVEFSVYGEGINPLDVPLAVTSTTNKRCDNYTFSSAFEMPLTNAYLVFDNPISGDWLLDSECMSYFSITAGDFTADPTTGAYILSKTIRITQSGNPANSYQRDVKLVVYDENGNRYETPPTGFVVFPEAAMAEPVVESVSYSFNADTLAFTITTLNADAIRIYQGAQFLASFDTQNSEAYTMTLHLEKDGYTDVPLTFKAYDAEYGEGHTGVTLTVPSSEDPVLGMLKISTPILPASILEQEDLAVSWTLTGGTAESYLISVSKGGTSIYSVTAAASTSSATIPGSCFTSTGTYDVTVTAQHSTKLPASATFGLQVTTQNASGIDSSNPTNQDVYDYVVEYLASLNYSNSESFADLVNLCCSILWKESSYIHIVDGEINKNVNSGNGGIDWGISQLNEKSHADKMDWAKSVNWKLAAAAGIDVALEKYHQLAIQNAATSGAAVKGYSYETARACATYSAYNTGANPDRFYTASDGRDTGFYNIYMNKPWLQGVSTSAINELSKINYIAVGTVSKAQSYGRVCVYSSASSDALNCGWLDVGDTVYIIGNPGGGSYYAFYTEHGACGYVRSAYIETTGNIISLPDNNSGDEAAEPVPVEQLPATVCTASKYSGVKTGDKVTFTVKAEEGSSNFKIKINDLSPVDCTPEFSGSTYKLDYIFKTTGANKVLITWTAPDGRIGSAKCQYNITVAPNKDDWNYIYLNGILNITKIDGKLGTDNQYGLYIMQSGAYIRGEKVNEFPIISASGTNWDVEKNLQLSSGKYYFGIVSTAANYAGGNTYAELGSFTVTEDEAREEKAMYVIDPKGADVYGGFNWFTQKPNNKYSDIRYENGDTVIIYVGAEINGYSKVKISGSDTRTAYIATACLAESSMGGSQTPSDSSAKDTFDKKLEALKALYGPNSFFTKNRQSCSDMTYDCHIIPSTYISCRSGSSYTFTETTKINDNLTINATSANPVTVSCNCLHSVKIDGTTVDFMASQCCGYARFVFYYLFGVHEQDSINLVGSNGFSISSADELKNKITEKDSAGSYIVKPGTYVRAKNGGSNDHSFIIERFDDSSIVILQCNFSSAHCKITENAYKWEDFYEKFSKYKKIVRLVVPEKYPFDTDDLPSASLNSSPQLLSDPTSSSDSLCYQISLFDAENVLDCINTITGSTSQGTSFEVSSRTGSVCIDIPMDPNSYELEIRQGGNIYHNGDEIPFRLPRLNFEVAITNKNSGEMQLYPFSLTKKAESNHCNINMLHVTFCDILGNVIANDVIDDFSTERTFSMPNRTATVIFSHNSDGNYSYVRYATEETLTEGRWIPVDVPANVDSDLAVFTLGVYSDSGMEAGCFTYTLVRQPKSSEAELISLEVEAYDVSGNRIGIEMFSSEGISEMNLPYGTDSIDLNAAISAFAEVSYTVNGRVWSYPEGISISDEDILTVNITAENGASAAYSILCHVRQTADTTGPAIRVIGNGGTSYESGSIITEHFEIEISDESWYRYDISCGGACIEEFIPSDTEYVITAYDVFGNTSYFTFWYYESGTDLGDFSNLIVNYDRSSREITLKNVPVHVHIMLAGYWSSKMVVIYSEQSTDGTLFWTLPEKDIDTLKVFCLDPSYLPLSPAKIIPLS